MKSYFVVKYEGHFGFIKPWTAMRDSETFSQQFLTPSIIEGMEKKIFPHLLDVKGLHKIKRHRINYLGLDLQQERTWSKGGFSANKEKNQYKTNQAVIKRGVMLEPHLYLAFETEKDAITASKEHICLCRNEDVMLPVEILSHISEGQFDAIDGFELMFDQEPSEMFKVGHNRYDEASAMYGSLRVYGNPIRQGI